MHDLVKEIDHLMTTTTDLHLGEYTSSKFSSSMSCSICSVKPSCKTRTFPTKELNFCSKISRNKGNIDQVFTTSPVVSAARTSVSISTSISIIEEIWPKNTINTHLLISDLIYKSKQENYFIYVFLRWREGFLFILLKKTYPSKASNQFNSSPKGVLQALSDPFDFTYSSPRYKLIMVTSDKIKVREARQLAKLEDIDRCGRKLLFHQIY